MIVTEALAKVAEELPSIGRDEQSPQGYAYRGIEQITKLAGPLLAKYGVVFVPQVQSIEVRDITVNNKPWTDTTLTVRYRIYGPSTTKADDFVEATTVGIGRDNSDKGANKAMTQAFKYALIQVLCIADGKDDGDNAHAEADTPPEMASASEREDLLTRLRDLGDYPPLWIERQLPGWKRNNIEALTVDDYLVALRLLDEAKVVGARDEGGKSEATAVADPAVGDAEPSLALGEPYGYGLWPRTDLEEECKARSIPHSGNMDRLVRELRAWDVAFDPDGREYDERQI